MTYMNHKPLQAIIYDVDGTLLDSMPTWNQSGDLYLQSKGLIPEPGLSRILFKMTLEESSYYLKNNYLIKENVESIARGIRQVVRTYYAKEVEAKPGSLKLLTSVYKLGIPQIVCTLTERDMVLEGLDRTGLLPYLDDVISCADLPWTKRDEELFLYLLNRLKTEADQTWLFEDASYSAQTAKRLGIKVVGLKDIQDHEDLAALKASSDIFLESFHDLDLSKLGI